VLRVPGPFRPYRALLGWVFVAALYPPAPASAAEVPAHLPRYDLDLTIDTAGHTARLRQRVTWTNHTAAPADHLAFNFYPNYRVPRGDYLHLAKTLEMLRLRPHLGIDRGGRAGVVQQAKLLSLAGKPCDEFLSYEYDEHNPTALRFPLPRPLNPGEALAVELVCDFHLPNKQGRLGHWNDVTYLTNSFPVLAFRDDTGWRPMPFVPWHQPFFNEAGVYRATITLPAGQTLVCPAAFKSETKLGDGRKRVETEPFVGRDFAVLCSPRYREYTAEAKLPDGQTVALRCVAFPEHEWYAKEMLRIVGEAIPVYSAWFGPFPYPSFTIVESFFGWNGNECAGLIMIDERVFDAPKLARGYVEYLVSHETCHQWWYNLVGTNGYAEPFMDEASAAYFTHRLLDAKHGKNNPFMLWPKGMDWLPNIHRENYHWGGMQYAIRNGDMTPAAQDLPRYGHLFHLFTGAYDRGCKAMGLVENRLGEAAFLDFTRTVATKYRWRVLQIADYRRELEAYTGRDWGEFFDRWIFGKGVTDWKVEDVAVADVVRAAGRTAPAAGRTRVTVTLRQSGEYTEPTTLGVRFAGEKGYTLRLPVDPAAAVRAGDDHDYALEPGPNGTVKVSFTAAAEPEQIEVDPDRVLLDANPIDNVWKPTARVRLVPLYTSLEETDLTSDYDRWNLTAGPWVWGASYQDPWYTRSTMVGLRAGVNKPQHFRAGVYTAIRSDYRDIVVGADATWLGDHLEFGLNYERRVSGPFGGLDGASGPERASAYVRHTLKPGSSLYLPPVMYQDVFATYQDNFLPFVRGRSPFDRHGARFDRLALAGYHYRLNLYTPYWDPDHGVWVDLVAGGGVADFDGYRGTAQGRVELAGVRQLPAPECWCFLKDWKVAGRVVGQAAYPDFGQFFALGGGTLFRGFDLAERQGSALWVANAEVRVPVAQNVSWNALDKVIGARNVWVAGFYDVGGVYSDGRVVNGVAHALGLGLRVDVAVFSFIERATLRVDVGKTINAPSPFQVWFGLQHAF
jgi:hypothetical protein